MGVEVAAVSLYSKLYEYGWLVAISYKESTIIIYTKSSEQTKQDFQANNWQGYQISLLEDKNPTISITITYDVNNHEIIKLYDSSKDNAFLDVNMGKNASRVLLKHSPLHSLITSKNRLITY